MSRLIPWFRSSPSCIPKAADGPQCRRLQINLIVLARHHSHCSAAPRYHHVPSSKLFQRYETVITSLSYFDFILTLCNKIKNQTKSFFIQIEISQSHQFKCPIVYALTGAISYGCFPTIMQHYVVKNAFISSHQMAQLRVPPIVYLKSILYKKLKFKKNISWKKPNIAENYIQLYDVHT